MSEHCEYAEAIGLLRMLFETYEESAGLFYDMLEESTTTHRWVVFSLDAYCAEREGDVIDGTAEGFDLGVIGEGLTPLEAVKDALAGVQVRKKPRRRQQATEAAGGGE